MSSTVLYYMILYGTASYHMVLPRGPKVVPFWASYIESYKVIPKRSYFGASGYIPDRR